MIREIRWRIWIERLNESWAEHCRGTISSGRYAGGKDQVDSMAIHEIRSYRSSYAITNQLEKTSKSRYNHYRHQSAATANPVHTREQNTRSPAGYFRLPKRNLRPSSLSSSSSLSLVFRVARVAGFLAGFSFAGGSTAARLFDDLAAEPLA